MIYTNYKEYLKEQMVRGTRKWGRKWDYDEIFKQQLHLTLDEVSEYIKPTSICCMGCRSGTEVFEFKERYPLAEVYGVDISGNLETIRTHLNVKFSLQDFNNLPVAWENKYDLVFSNSLDHAYKPSETIQEWHRVTVNEGYLLLEFSTTPENNIEHSFKLKDLPALLPSKQFEHTIIWPSPERNIITGLFKVIK